MQNQGRNMESEEIEEGMYTIIRYDPLLTRRDIYIILVQWLHMKEEWRRMHVYKLLQKSGMPMILHRQPEQCTKISTTKKILHICQPQGLEGERQREKKEQQQNMLFLIINVHSKWTLPKFHHDSRFCTACEIKSILLLSSTTMQWKWILWAPEFHMVQQ